jgi:hypothetical protein
MDTVSGRADNLRHVCPHGVKSFSDEGASIACTGYGYFTGVRLLPGVLNNTGFPVGITKCFVLRVDNARKDPFGAFLYAAKTTHAGVKKLRVFHGAYMFLGVLKDFVNTFFLDAFSAASCTVFTKFNCCILSHRVKAGFGGLYMDMIFFRHGILQAE